MCTGRCASCGWAKVSTPQGNSRPTRWRAPSAALVDYAALLDRFEVGKVRMVATSATRDAANRDEFFA